jgi:N4-gp56 family major capsid protein
MASDFATDFTGTSQYDDVSYAAIITDAVLDALMATVVTPQFLRHENLAGAASKAMKFPKAAKFTAAALTEGVEVANTPLTDTSVTITAAEIGIQATITDVLEVSDIPAAHGARLRQLGRSLADKLDVDICTLLGGFSNVVGTTTADLALANLLDAIYTLEVNDADGTGAAVAVLHPRQTADLRNAVDAEAGVAYSQVAGSRAAELGQAKSPGYFGTWFGIPIYQSTNVPTVNAGADRGGGMFTSGYALGMVEKWGAKVETMRWPPIRGFVLTATAMYGVGEIEDAAGVEIATDA